MTPEETGLLIGGAISLLIAVILLFSKVCSGRKQDEYIAGQGSSNRHWMFTFLMLVGIGSFCLYYGINFKNANTITVADDLNSIGSPNTTTTFLSNIVGPVINTDQVNVDGKDILTKESDTVNMLRRRRSTENAIKLSNIDKIDNKTKETFQNAITHLPMLYSIGTHQHRPLKIHSEVEFTGGIKGQVFTINSTSVTETELSYIHENTPGIAKAGKALIVDSNYSIHGLTNVTANRFMGTFFGTSETQNSNEFSNKIATTWFVKNAIDNLDSSTNSTSSGHANRLDALENLFNTSAGLTIGDAALLESELEFLDDVNPGTASANKAVVLDASKNITGLGDVTSTGTIAAVNLDISGNVDVVGTANLDVVDIDGAVDMASTLTCKNVTSTGTITASAFSGSLTGAVTGNAVTATKLEGTVTIGGVNFDGSANIDLPGVNTVGNQSTTGNAATATALETGRTIGGVNFDGSVNIDLPGVNIIGNQSTTGNAATATKFEDTVTIGGVSFDGSANIDLLAANIKIGEDEETKIDFETENEIHFYANNTEQVYVADGIFGPKTDSEVDLGSTAVRWKDAFVDSITVTGEVSAASLDISGNVDIDGTLEADAITVNAVALSVVIEDTTGAMFSSNTETGVTVTYQEVDNTVDVVINAAQTTITSLLATDIQIGEDDETKIDFETANEIHFYANNTEQVYVADGIFGPEADSDVDLGSDTIRWKNAFVDSITVTGEISAVSLDISGNVDIDGTVDMASTLSLANSAASYSSSLTNIVSTSASAGSAVVSSGALHVPAGSLITNIHVIVSAQLTQDAGTVGIKVGTSSGTDGIVAADPDALQSITGTTTNAGKGISTNSYTREALQGVADMIIIAGQAYRSADTEVHVTVTGTGTNGITAGTVKFVVEFIKLA